jgi:hypothetical protein
VVWDDYPSTQEEFLNQDKEFIKKFNQISDLKKLAWVAKPDPYVQRDLLRKIKKEQKLLKSIIIKKNLMLVKRPKFLVLSIKNLVISMRL